MASTIQIAAAVSAVGGPLARSAEEAQREGVERLSRLTRRLEAVAEKLSSPDKSRAERSVLRTQFNELERQVNRLDGIVAAEGQESGGRSRLVRAETAAAAPLGTAVPRARAAPAPPGASTRSPAPSSGPVSGADTPSPGSGVDLLV